MVPYPKRLIEVDLPIREISVHARREKSIRHGHISTLYIWWARRPLAALPGSVMRVPLARSGRRKLPAGIPGRGRPVTVLFRRTGAAR